MTVYWHFINTKQGKPMNKIRTLASGLSLFYRCAVFTTPFVCLFYWLNIGHSNWLTQHISPWTHIPNGTQLLTQYPLSINQRWSAIGMNSIWICLTCFQQYFLACFFAQVAKGQTFCIESTTALKRVAQCLLFWQLLRPFVQVFTDQIISRHLPTAHGAHYVMLTLSTQNIMQLIIAATLWIIAAAFHQGTELKQEQALTV